VAFYIFALDPSLWIVSVLVLVCSLLTFVPWKWVHPMRVVALRKITLSATAVWAIASASILWMGFPAHWVASVIIVLIAIYGVALSLRFGPARKINVHFE
jgi:phosphatidylcholine synthase